MQLANDYAEYRSANVRIVVISSQAPINRRFLELAESLPFPWLLDRQSEVIKRYGVYNRFSYDAWKVAHPAAILVDMAGTVRFIHRSSHQWDMPHREITLAAVKSLPAAGCS